MFSHVTVGTRDLERAGRFYDAVLSPLGLRRRPVSPDGGPAALCWVAAHAAGLAHGGADAGAPGPRPRYGNGYYGAYLRDPDGNKIHIVHRADLLP